MPDRYGACVVRSLEASFKSMRGGRYDVRIGPVDWAAWNFETSPLGVGILQIDGTPLPLSHGFREGRFEIEVLTKVPINDQPEASDLLASDLATALHALNYQDASSVDPPVTIDEAEMRYSVESDPKRALLALNMQFTAFY